MKILLTGSNGQLGHAIRNTKPSFLGEEKIDLLTMTRKELDLANPEKCKQIINQIKPDWVINAAAYTAVDAAEDNKELAMTINGKAPKAIAEALLTTGGKLIQISTDFVFDGRTGSPIKTNHERNPLNAYGRSKAAAEEYLEERMIPHEKCVIIRTSWLMSHVGENFALTIVKLHKELENFSVVSDQVGSPTTTYSLSKACWKLLERNVSGKELPAILHWCDAGAASWYDIAIAIGELGEELGIINKKANVNSISTSDYLTKATRPGYSILDCFNSRAILELEPLNWRVSLKEIMENLARKE